MSRRRAHGSGLLTLALLAAACDRPERSPVEQGAGVFARSCAGCHGPTGRGAKPPGFSTAPRDLTDPELQARLSDSLIRETIQYGKGQMPPFGRALPPDDVTHVIAFVRSIARPTPRAAPSNAASRVPVAPVPSATAPAPASAP